MNSSQIHCKCLHGICTATPPPSFALSARTRRLPDSSTLPPFNPTSDRSPPLAAVHHYLYRLNSSSKIGLGPPVKSTRKILRKIFFQKSFSTRRDRRRRDREAIENRERSSLGGRGSMEETRGDVVQRRREKEGEREREREKERERERVPPRRSRSRNFARKLLSRTEARPQRSVVLPGSSSSPVYGRM